MKLHEIVLDGSADILTEGMAEALKAKVVALIGKIEKINGIAPFLNSAKGKKSELAKLFKSAKDGNELKAQIQSMATAMAKQKPVSEGFVSSAIVSGLSVLATGALAAMASAVGIYHQMGQPDLVSGSNLNMAGGIIFGVVPPLMAATLALLTFIQARKSAAYDKKYGSKDSE